MIVLFYWYSFFLGNPYAPLATGEFGSVVIGTRLPGTLLPEKSNGICDRIVAACFVCIVEVGIARFGSGAALDAHKGVVVEGFGSRWFCCNCH